MSGVQDNQVANEGTFNNAFMKENGDTGTIGKMDLNNADSASGTAIINVQRQLNSILSFLGAVANQVKTYTPTWVNNNGLSALNDIFTRTDTLSGKFDQSTGHTHSGVAGDGAPIVSTSLSGVILRGYFVRGTDIASPSGSSTNVTSQMSGKAASSGTAVKGVVVTFPYNRVNIRQLSNAGAGDQLLDLLGNEVYGRITESAGTWTLSYYVDLDGIQTAYTMTAGQTTNGIKWWYQQLYNPITDAPVYNEMLDTPSDNTTQDVVDASGTQRGVVTTGAQSFAGKKTFNDGSDMNSKNITSVLNPVSAQDAATKNYVDTALAGVGVFGKNRIINGCMRIDQRNAGGSTTLSNSYALDRWENLTVNAGVVTVQRVTDSLPSGFTHAMKLTVTTADAAVAGTDRLSFQQKIEGSNIYDFDYGRATAKTATLSFWVRSSKTGIYSCVFANGAGTRFYAAEYTINSANTWEKKTVTLTGDTTGAFNTDNTTGLIVRFGLMAGVSRTLGTLNTWITTSDVYGSTNQVNWLDTLSATFYITGVQLELGTVATNYDVQIISELIAKCKRYYESVDGYFTTSSTAGTFLPFMQPFTVEKRDTPTITNSNVPSVGIAAQNISKTNYSGYFNASGTSSSIMTSVANAEL